MSQVFINRDAEIEEIKEAMDAVNEKGSMYFITGPTGIGKTSLCTHVGRIAEENGFLVLTERCFNENSVPYFPIHEVFRQLSRVEKKNGGVYSGRRGALLKLVNVDGEILHRKI
ncbi:MAG: ATP-binding protein [Thermoplasmata archaeon]